MSESSRSNAFCRACWSSPSTVIKLTEHPDSQSLANESGGTEALGVSDRDAGVVDAGLHLSGQAHGRRQQQSGV